MLVMLSSCQKDSDSVSNDEEQVDDSSGDNSGNDDNVENVEGHEDAEDYIWDSSEVIFITLNGTSITEDTDSAEADGSTVTITSPGTYSFSGTLTDGQIIVDTDEDGIVRLILNGVNISSSSSAPIFISSAEKTLVVLNEGTENYLTDSDSYVFEGDDDEPNAALFSKDDLTIYGEGSLTVTGNYNDAIASKDGLIIRDANINVISVDDGIRGKDYLIVKDGTIDVDAGGDGLKSDNEDAGTGYISIDDGDITIDADGDAMQAESDVIIADGTFDITTGGGSGSSYDDDSSIKGIKAGVSIEIDGGTFTVNSADDAVHSNGSLQIDGGSFALSSGDDGIHADSSIIINDGEINIAKSYEGIESAVITINDGDINIVSSDDGINVAGGNDGSTTGRPGSGSFNSSTDYYLYINGGYIVVDATGDGMDSNGSIVMTDGTVIINGPTSSQNGAIDYNSTFTISGGILLAAGSSGMAQAPSSSSSQHSVSLTFKSQQQAGTLVHVQTSGGDEIFTFAPSKKFQSLVFSLPELAGGTTYSIYYGGSSTGTESDGLYDGGEYTPGTLYNTFTISGTNTNVN